MKSVFVTGASGFVGVQLVTKLRAMGIQVRCLVRQASRRLLLEPLGVEFVEGDVRDIDSLRRGADGVDTVFHVAGIISANNLGAFMAVNKDGCRNVAQAIASRRSVMRIYFPSVFSIPVMISSMIASGSS